MKKNNHSKLKKKQTKEPSWYQRYRNLQSWRKNPVSDAFIEKLCEEIMEHFDNPKNIHFIRFLRERGILFETFLEWVDKHQNLADVYHFVMEQIGEERENQAMYRKYNTEPKTIHFTLRHYNPFWKKTMVEDAALRANDDEKEKIKVVILEKAEETSVKPMQLIEDEARNDA